MCRPVAGSLEAMLIGLLALLATCLLWGLTVVAPVVVPAASATAIVGGRFVVLGVVALLVGARRWRALGWPHLQTWRLAARLAAQGFVGFYLLLVLAIQLAGPGPAAAVIGCTPVAYALAGARRERLALRPLGAPVAVMALGLAVVHGLDLATADAGGVAPMIAGMLCATAGLIVWIGYGLDNAAHVRTPGVDLLSWTCTVGVAAGALSLPLLAHAGLTGGIGPQPGRWAAVVVVLGVGSAWMGTRAWNIASSRLPEVVIGPLLVGELVASLAYVHLLAGTRPSPVALTGYGLLVVGVVASLLANHAQHRHTDCNLRTVPASRHEYISGRMTSGGMAGATPRGHSPHAV